MYEEDSPSPVQVEAVNISLGGIKFFSNTPIPIFTLLTIRLIHKEGDKPTITIKGKVVRTEMIDVGLPEKSYGIAVKFSEEDSSAYRELMDSLPQSSDTSENSRL